MFVNKAEEADHDHQQEQRKLDETWTARKLLSALAIIVCLAISRGCGIQLKYSILNDCSKEFYPPFLLMWFNNSCLIVCFPVYLLIARIASKNSGYVENVQKSARIFSKTQFKISSFLWMEFIFLLLFNANNYTNSLSLGRISTSAALSIHSLEVSFVYVLGRLFLGEQFHISKTLGVLLAMGGVVLIALDNEFAADFLGVFLKLCGCIASSVYKVGFKRAVGEATPGQSMFFLSGMGLVNLLVNLPPALLLLHFGLEKFDSSLIPWPQLLGFILLTFVFNFATIFGIAILSPVIISIGLLSGVPISIGIDIALRKHIATWKFLLGAAFLVISVLLATLHERIGSEWRKKRWRRRIRRDQEGQESEHVEEGEKLSQVPDAECK